MSLYSAMRVARKDLLIERRTRVGLGQVVPFAITVLLMFAFGLDPDSGVLGRGAMGLYWITVLLATVLAVQRSLSVEMAAGGRDHLRLCGIDLPSMFFGKVCALVVQLFVLQMFITLGVMFLYDVKLYNIVLLLATSILATVGISAVGTTYAAISMGSKGAETLLPLLLLPAMTPVLLGATRACEAFISNAASDAWPWLQLLFGFACIYLVVGAYAFGLLLED